ncbi:MAG TPA: O-antigen polymerase, partial [Ignavibacteriaceae bacterium]|nr:O-antigen polymerase [Ignavibacteriaceae bacterium]
SAQTLHEIERIKALRKSVVVFKSWLNHVVIYTVIWGGMLFLYELKLMKYTALTDLTWIAVIISFLTFVLGSVTYKYVKDFQKHSDSAFQSTFLLDGAKNLKFLKITIIITGTISLLGAIQHWAVLFDMFGSITSILINANTIYRMRVQEEIPGVIPYVSAFGFVAVFFAAIESAIKGRFTFLSFYAIVGVMLKEFAMLGRAGILIAFVEYFVVLFFVRLFLKKQTDSLNIKKKSNLTLSLVITLIIFIMSASLVKNVRGAFESYRSSTKELNKLKGGLLITPSIYLYFSAHIGVFSRYLWDDSESSYFGENTFLPVYRIISKFGVVDPPSYYQKGYNIPMWTNTGTYLRELHADFGSLGIFLVPYLLGFLTSFYWFKFLKSGNLKDILILSHLYIIIVFSFLTMITRSSNLIISFVVIYMIIFLFEKYKFHQREIENKGEGQVV